MCFSSSSWRICLRMSVNELLRFIATNGVYDVSATLWRLARVGVFPLRPSVLLVLPLRGRFSTVSWPVSRTCWCSMAWRWALRAALSKATVARLLR